MVHIPNPEPYDWPAPKTRIWHPVYGHIATIDAPIWPQITPYPHTNADNHSSMSILWGGGLVNAFVQSVTLVTFGDPKHSGEPFIDVLIHN